MEGGTYDFCSYSPTISEIIANIATADGDVSVFAMFFRKVVRMLSVNGDWLPPKDKSPARCDCLAGLDDIKWVFCWFSVIFVLGEFILAKCFIINILVKTTPLTPIFAMFHGMIFA